MKLGLFVNDLDMEEVDFATTLLGAEAMRRGHTVCYCTPESFSLHPDDSLHVRGVFPPRRKYASYREFFKAVQSRRQEWKTIDVTELDALLLRSDPSLDVAERQWAESSGIQFGRFAAERGVLVLNDPDGLSLASNKLYFQTFPEALRVPTLISKNVQEIKQFASDHHGKVVLKPVRGSGGQSVFLVGSEAATNLNQMIDAVARDGYVIAQTYLPAAREGDIRLFLMNGEPLQYQGHYAAFRRRAASDDVRSNIHAGGSAEKANIGDQELAIAELVRPKLKADGMFLVGLDIVGDKLLEINVFTPGGLRNCGRFENVRFSTAIIEGIERKLDTRARYPGRFDNRQLAAM